MIHLGRQYIDGSASITLNQASLMARGSPQFACLDCVPPWFFQLLYTFNMALREHFTKAAVSEMLPQRALYSMIIPFSMPVKSRDLPITAIIAMRTRTLKPPLYSFQQTGFSVLPVIGHNCVYVNLRGGHNIGTRLYILLQKSRTNKMQIS
ncbi:hypothetical protein AVEN_243054-1 [Araneus ventricosus]|uniref:Uncharacterized protein n=1 Tax=Araneus ventricosus TaxID=182803 RepID=A0A4Y2KBS3_ARAVE|nr:hypothetical protein AVEN_243054-1 [Araneus ventricosus]